MNFNLLNNPSGLSLTRILSSISKSLSLIEQIKPIYNNVKPLFKYLPNLYTNNYVEEKPSTKIKTPSNNNTISFFN